jgi:nucleoside phosphorylase
MARRRLDAAEYTVGWICALPIELAAAQVMLDEEHLPHDGVNSTQYTLGRIGSHNVVLACLPAGQMGIAAAAFSAGQATSIFTSIRFGLMVGVGGGAPSAEADVRLGDVVISHPVREHSGVVQYDFGKAGKDGRMTRTGSMNAPPKTLLHAVSQLRAHRYRYQDEQDTESLATHLSAFSQHLRFSRETAGPDVLFKSSYHHEGKATCRWCNKDMMVRRKAREADEEVTIHYGTIASGNQVIKDAPTRDRLSEELGGVLCFEMEAAGLMNDFPCLVVRGICDYADSHKNKAWQPYAAATAAACAKSILSLVPAVEVLKTTAVGEPSNYRIPFSLKGVPVVGKFAERPKDTQALERALLQEGDVKERRLLVLHGLGGMGKTQLAANFARRHRNRFSSVLWLDGSGESTLKQSLAAFASRIPEGQISETSRQYATNQGGNTDTVVQDVLSWLSMSDNKDWLMIIDNVDRDDRRRDEDNEAYRVEEYLPGADHGSVLITTRLLHLGQLAERWEARKVDKEQARAILRTLYTHDIG